jgi:hypothetical protein
MQRRARPYFTLMSKPKTSTEAPADAASKTVPNGAAKAERPAAKVPEIGGPPGPEPTRYGDWQIKGRVSDF